MTEGRWVGASIHVAGALVLFHGWLRTEFREAAYRALERRSRVIVPSRYRNAEEA